MLRLFLAFLLLPLIDTILLVRVAASIGFLPTMLLVVLTAWIGAFLARREGTRAWRQFRETTASGALPGREIGDGLMIAFAAALLLTPGLLTDAIGLGLLIPAGRNWVRKRVVAPMLGSMNIRVVTPGNAATHSHGDHYDAGPMRGGASAKTIDAVEVVRRR